MTKQIRLMNFVLDSIVFFIIVVVFSFLLKDLVEREDMRIVMIILYYFYYFGFELFNGQTIGKMITKTKVVNVDDDKKPKLGKIVVRTLSRLIPIDILSYLFLSNGIHDLLSGTKLVRFKQNY